MRIRPTVEISRPEMSAFTAKYRIAPSAIRKMLVPMPTGRSPSQGYIQVSARSVRLRKPLRTRVLRSQHGHKHPRLTPLRALRRPCGLPRHDPPDRARAGRPAGGRDRRQGRVPVGSAQAVRRAGPARPAVRGGVRRHRHRDADAQHGDRGGRQGVRLDRADPDGAGARHAADPPVRLRRAQAALPAALRERRVVARPSRCPSPRRAPTPAACSPPPSATATSGSSTAPRTGSPTSAIADFYVVFAVTDRESPPPLRLRRRGRPPRLQRRQARAQARHQGLADRPADLRRRPHPARATSSARRARA